MATKKIIGIVGTPFELTPAVKKGFEGRTTGTRTTYENALIKAGAIPIVLSPLQSLPDIKKQLQLVDGLIFQGGGGDKDTEILQVTYIKEALLKNLPVLGICMGMQLLNVACGGTLKNIGNMSHKQNTPLYKSWHNIHTQKDSLLDKLFGHKIKVNSYHQYRVNKLGKNIIATAKSEDEVIEAISHQSKTFVHGVQFHPEHLLKKEESWLELFRALIASCK